MTEIGQHRPLRDAIIGLDTGDSRALLDKELKLQRQHLRELPADSDPIGRAKVNLDIATLLLGLNRTIEAWELGREVFDVFTKGDRWEKAIEACDIMYQADQELSIAALGQGVWLSVTYPVNPELTVNMLHHIVDETPDHSDGGAVAAAVAHYIAGIRAEGKQRVNIMFLTAQKLAEVAKRHRGIEDEDSINLWMELLELNDPSALLPRLAKIIDIMVGQHWWIDRDALRARLPVN
jgi:hypothetical protein